jgi:hypothetical protein
VSRPATVLLATAALLGAGCGAERVRPPDPSQPFATLPPAPREFPAAGVRFRAPGDLPFAPAEAPLVTTTSTGSATIAIWRYPRTEPLPRDDAALDEAERSLRDAVRTRDPQFDVERVRRVRVDGARALEVRGTGRVAGRVRQMRSTHVYAKGAEFVIDAYAAPDDFRIVDDAIFEPLMASLKIDPPRA